MPHVSGRTRFAGPVPVAMLTGLIAGLGLSACSDTPGEAGTSANPALESLLVDARAHGAAPEEIAVLELAIAEDRNVTFEEYKQAANRSMDCLRDLGFEVMIYQERQQPGWIQISYGYGGVSDEVFEALDAAGQACQNDHIMWMQFAYQLNARDVDYDAVYEQYRPAMIECVNNNGGALPADATITDAVDADAELTANDLSIQSCVTITGLDEVL